MSTRRIVDLLIASRYLLAVAWLALAAAGWWFAPSVAMQRSIDRLFDSRDGEYRSYQTAIRVFGPREPILVAYRDPKAFDADGSGLERLERLAEHLESLDGVVETTSLADLDALLQETLGARIVDDGLIARRMTELLQGLTHSADRRTVAIVCLLDKEQPGESRRRTIESIRSWLAERADTYLDAAVVGEPVMIDEGFRMLERDGRRLSFNAGLLLALVLLLTFRSLRWAVIAGAVVQTSLSVARLSLAVSGAQLTLVSTMFGSVVTVIAVASVMHWIVRFRERQAAGDDRRQALRTTLEQILAPTFWACATDAAGFAALLVASVEPVRDFGAIMIVGSLAVLLALVCLVPAAILPPLPRSLAWLDPPPPLSGASGSLLDRLLERPLESVRRRPAIWFVLVPLAVGAAAFGLTRVRVETDFTRNFRAGSPILEDYRFVEERLGGAGVWEILVPLEGELDWNRVQRIRQLESRLRNEVRIGDLPSTVSEESPAESSASEQPPATAGEPALTQVLSIADALTGVIDIERLERIPMLNDFVISQGLEQFRTRLPGLHGSLLAEDPDRPGAWYVRILLRSRQQLPAEIQQGIIDQVRAICADEAKGWPIDRPPVVTGWYVLLARIVDHLLADQWLTLGVATVAILLLSWAATRRLSRAVIAVVPNLLPIAVLLGALGWLGIPINMGVALIAAVSVGLSIDSTLHYLEIVRRRTRDGASATDAIDSAQHRAGAASVFATIALVGGFATMVVSEFLPTVYFGALVCAAMLGGLIGNLLVLPLLLVWLDRRR
ncbi:MAG TPA: MMPL family transporter [Pirellulaceae bacterium]|nr:MMPL family transporter [Pirellulaceae bacterium]